MKRMCLAMMLVGAVCGAQAAASSVWQEVTWAPFQPITAWTPLTYTHNLTGILGPTDQVESATLTLTFVGDWGDGGWLRPYEVITTDLDGVEWFVGEVDNGSYSRSLAVASLQDRELTVVMEMLNAPAFIGLQKSRLDVNYVSTTVGAPHMPEPLTFVTCGAAVAALGRYVRRRVAA